MNPTDSPHQFWGKKSVTFNPDKLHEFNDNANEIKFMQCF